MAEHIPKPDAAFFLETSVDTAIDRVHQRPEEAGRYINNEFQQRLCNAFNIISAKNGGVKVMTDNGAYERELCEAVFDYIKPIILKGK